MQNKNSVEELINRYQRSHLADINFSYPLKNIMQLFNLILVFTFSLAPFLQMLKTLLEIKMMPDFQEPENHSSIAGPQ